MQSFSRLKEAYSWVEANARGWVCVRQSNALLLMNPWCRGDMRIVENVEIDRSGCIPVN